MIEIYQKTAGQLCSRVLSPAKSKIHLYLTFSTATLRLWYVMYCPLPQHHLHDVVLRYEYSNTTLNALKYEKFHPSQQPRFGEIDLEYPYLAVNACNIDSHDDDSITHGSTVSSAFSLSKHLFTVNA
jgi:hypothetical protein